MCFVPESPRYYVHKRNPDAALAVLERIRGSKAAATAELREIETIAEEEGHFKWAELIVRCCCCKD